MHRTKQELANADSRIAAFEDRLIINQNNPEGLISLNAEIKEFQASQLAEKIRRWLCAPDSSENYNSAREKHQADTSCWFLDGAQFREWQDQPGFFWIKGSAGCGKTILCSSIINKIEKLCKERKSTALAYFFFDGRVSHDNLIRSLISRLWDQWDGIPPALVKLHDRHNGWQQPSTAELQETLLSSISKFHSTYIIIDSLDGCINRERTLPWIKNIVSQKIDNLHLIVSSRPELDIINVLEPLDLHCLDLTRNMDGDIGIYLDQQLATMEDWDFDEETREIVKSTLARDAQGIFRWVALQLEELKKHSDHYSIKKQLDSLPDGLRDMYDQVLMETDEIHFPAYETFLRWLCFSVRPMTMAEMAETATVDLEAKDGPRYEPSCRFFYPRLVLEMGSVLISESKGTLQLSHFSIKQYLMSEHLLTGAISNFHLTEERSHALISQTCLAYLLQFDTLCSTFESSPLARYAAEHWIFHAQAGGIDKPELSPESACALALAKRLFESEEAAFTNWVRIYDLDTPPIKHRANGTDIGAPLYYASLAGLKRLSQHLLEEEADVNAHGGVYGTALQAASYKGHVAVVKLLLERGADVSARGGYYGCALKAAESQGHKAIVKLLQ